MRRDVTEEYLSDKWKYSMAAFDGVTELHIYKGAELIWTA